MPEVFIEGKRFTATESMTVAAAVLSAGYSAFRSSVTGEPRGPLCGMGICYECRVTIDGQPHARSCQILCRDSMVIELA